MHYIAPDRQCTATDRQCTASLTTCSDTMITHTCNQLPVHQQLMHICGTRHVHIYRGPQFGRTPMEGVSGPFGLPFGTTRFFTPASTTFGLPPDFGDTRFFASASAALRAAAASFATTRPETSHAAMACLRSRWARASRIMLLLCTTSSWDAGWADDGMATTEHYNGHL